MEVIPSTIKKFLWRIRNNAILVGENLFKRKVLEDSHYHLWKENNESILHAIRDYQYARQVWALSNIGIHILFFEARNVGY